MRLGDITGYSILLESRLDRYAQMIESLKNIDNALYTRLYMTLKTALSELKREDRILYTMRWAKYTNLLREEDFLNQAVRAYPRDSSYREKLPLVQKELRKIKSKLNTEGENSITPGTQQWFTDMGHFLSLGLHKIEQIVWDKQTPDALYQEMREIERAWQAETAQSVDMTSDAKAKPVLKFPDGSAWFNLSREYCRTEGDAMGHCGNSASPKPGDRVLSYRIPTGYKGIWRPEATFILDKDGYLGEMKGRDNKKPRAELHPYIIELLKQPFVNGIKGGGHDPAENFSMNDLDRATRERLQEQYPKLLAVAERFDEYGLTEHIRQELSVLGESVFGNFYIDGDKAIVLQTRDEDYFIRNYAPEDVKHAHSMVNGYGFSREDQSHRVEPEDITHLLETLEDKNPQEYSRLLEYIRSKYADYIEEEDLDLDLVGDVYQVLYEFDDSIIDQFSEIAEEGYNQAITEFYSEAIADWLNDPFDYGSDYGDFQAIWSGGDSAFIVYMDISDFAHNIENIIRDEVNLFDIMDFNHIPEPEFLEMDKSVFDKLDTIFIPEVET